MTDKRFDTKCDGQYKCPKWVKGEKWGYPDSYQYLNECPFYFGDDKCYIKFMIREMIVGGKQ